MDVSGIRLRFPGVGVDISLVHSIQTDFGVRAASCPMGIVGCLSGGVKQSGREDEYSPPYNVAPLCNTTS